MKKLLFATVIVALSSMVSVVYAQGCEGGKCPADKTKKEEKKKETSNFDQLGNCCPADKAKDDKKKEEPKKS